MRFTKTLLLPLFLFLLSVNVVQAQDATAPKEVTSSFNMLAVTMIAVALILAFVIFSMGQVLLTLVRQMVEKQKNNAAPPVLLMLFFLSLVSSTGNAQDMVTEEAVKVLPNYGGLSATAFWILFITILTEIIVILFMMFYINRIKQELVPAKVKKPLRLAAWWKRMDKKFFTNAVAVEKENDIQLDHDYDGIKELDNSLPPWWKWGFIITIFFAVFYLLNFHVFGSGKNPTEEYEAELAAAKIKMEAYNAKNKDKVDENNIVLADESGIAKGKEIFQQVCWACHGKMGEGGAGPNLTDEYWLHKGSLTDVFKSIKHGYPDKGMQAWEKQYSPKDISNITSYISTLKGTNPPGAKAPQGDLFVPAVADSATTVFTENAQNQ